MFCLFCDDSGEVVIIDMTFSRNRWLRGFTAFPGFCPIQHCEELSELGFDCIEPALTPLAEMSKVEFCKVRDRIRETGLLVDSTNWFVPSELKVVGDSVDMPAVYDYLDRALPRASALGARTIVFGSPGARTIPDGFPRERAIDQLKQFLAVCAAHIASRDLCIRIALEAINRSETNFINHFSEALEIVSDLDLPEVGLTADYYHFIQENESFEKIAQAGSRICTVQLSEPEQRGVPTDGVPIPRMEEFFEALEQAEYRGSVSIEAIVESPASQRFRNGLAFFEKHLTPSSSQILVS